MPRSLASALVSFSLLLLLAACNTTAGAGEDISSAGHAVTHAADSVKP
jgi:predicted small secreted protein